MRNKLLKIALFIVGAILLLFGSYYQFMGVQALLTMFSKEFALIIPELGTILVAFELTGLFVYVYKIYFYKNDRNSHHYKMMLLRNGILQALFSLTAIVILIINACDYAKFGTGSPTFGYPFDYLALALIGLIVGVISIIGFIKKSKVADTSSSEPKRPLAIRIIHEVVLYLCAFVAFDRLGLLVFAIFIGSDLASFAQLIPVLLMSFVLIISLLMQVQYKTHKNKTKPVFWLVGAALNLSIALLGTIYMIAMLQGSDATSFMRLTSPFYGADRLISLPITFILISIMNILPPLTSVVMQTIRCIKKK